MPNFRLSRDQQETLMREALIESQRGMDAGEVPIGCVIALFNDGSPKIVARGYNRVNALKRKIAHAEIIAFENASGDGTAPPSLPLDAKDAILVSTLEPCVMCLGAAMEAGVSTILFGLAAPADNGTQRVQPPQSPESSAPEIIGNILAKDSRKLFEIWLSDNANTEQAKFVNQLLTLTN